MCVRMRARHVAQVCRAHAQKTFFYYYHFLLCLRFQIDPCFSSRVHRIPVSAAHLTAVSNKKDNLFSVLLDRRCNGLPLLPPLRKAENGGESQTHHDQQRSTPKLSLIDRIDSWALVAQLLEHKCSLATTPEHAACSRCRRGCPPAPHGRWAVDDDDRHAAPRHATS